MSNGNVTYNVFEVDTPVITPGTSYYTLGQAISVSIAEDVIGAVLLYTIDGTDPTLTTSPVYSGPFTVTAPAIVKAIAVGATTSNIAESDFLIHEVVQPPIITPAPGSYQGGITVAMSTTTVGASIYYTIDGTTPTSITGVLYTNPVVLSSTTKIKAVAIKTNDTNSSITSAVYTITSSPTAPAPTITPASGQYTTSTVVTIQTALASGTIHYTTDGTTPTSTSPIYIAPFAVTEGTKVQAVVIANNYKNSAVTSASYVIATPQHSYLNIYDFKMGLRKVTAFATDTDI